MNVSREDQVRKISIELSWGSLSVLTSAAMSVCSLFLTSPCEFLTQMQPNVATALNFGMGAGSGTFFPGSLASIIQQSKFATSPLICSAFPEFGDFPLFLKFRLHQIFVSVSSKVLTLFSLPQWKWREESAIFRPWLETMLVSWWIALSKSSVKIPITWRAAYQHIWSSRCGKRSRVRQWWRPSWVSAQTKWTWVYSLNDLCHQTI